MFKYPLELFDLQPDPNKLIDDILFVLLNIFELEGPFLDDPF